MSGIRLLLANYRYFVSGGPERYLFNVSNLLEEHDHTVIPFSIKYDLNHPTEYEPFFVDPLGEKDQVYFRDQKKDPKTVYRTTKRLFYDPVVARKVMALADDVKPDVAYVLHYLRKLSPSLLVGLKKKNIPIVVRLSDYAMLCPQAHFLRGKEVCENCLKYGLLQSVKYKCVQNSFPASLLNFTATKFHSFLGFFDLIDCFVITNQFMYQKMVEAGFSEERLRLVPTFVNTESFPISLEKQSGLVVYVGRLEKIKGVHILLESVCRLKNLDAGLKFKLKIYGDGNSTYKTYLHNYVEENGLMDWVEFCGQKSIDEIKPVLSKAQVSVIPSLWYENLPNTLLESYACGTSVVASKQGSLENAVDDGRTGLLFKPGDSEDLSLKLYFSVKNPLIMKEMGNQARELAIKKYSPEKHLDQLESLFSELVYKNN